MKINKSGDCIVNSFGHGVDFGLFGDGLAADNGVLCGVKRRYRLLGVNRKIGGNGGDGLVNCGIVGVDVGQPRGVGVKVSYVKSSTFSWVSKPFSSR